MKLRLRLFRGLGLVGLILGGCFLGVAISSVATVDSAWAQGSEQIVVQGNRRVEAETIRSYFRSSGGRLDTAAIDEALKALYGTGLFQDVRITPSGNRLVVTVVENPVINRVAFEGNLKLKDDQLLLELQTKPRGSLSRPAVQADVQRLIEIYRRNGRFDVTVNPKIIELPNNRVDLVFEVKEGGKTGIRKLIFIGNNSYSDTRLKDEIKTSETIPLIGFLQTQDIYDPDRIEADRDLLRRFYLKKGYADIRIVSAVAVYDPAQKGFTVTFTIDEGRRYRYGKVEIISHVSAVDANSLYGRLRAAPGGVYNAEGTEKSVENLAIEVARRGYPFAVVRPRGDRDVENARINIAFVIDEGPRVYIERINIRGNTRTRDYVIRREFDIAEGDAYNRALIDRAERRLKNLNYFKVVKFSNEPGSASDRIVINVDVEEQATGEFSITGGYSTADGFLAEVSVAERNLLGHGQYAKASVQYGQRARGFELSYAEPYFMGNRMLVGVDVFARQTLSSTYYSYDNKTIGAGVRAGFLLTEESSFMARYNVYQQEISLPYYLNDCIYSPNAIINGGPGVNQANEPRASIRLATRRSPAAATRTAKPALPSARNWPKARSSCRCLATPRSTTRSTTTGRRPAASSSSSSRTLRELAATSISSVRPPACAATTRCLPTSWRSSICRAATSPVGAAKSSACWITSRWGPTSFAASRRPASAPAILRRRRRMLSAAPCTGAPAWRHNRQFPTSRGMSA